MRNGLRSLMWLTLLAAVGVAAHEATAQSNEPAAAFTAFAVDMSGVGPSSSGTVEIVIERWSSQAEEERLRKVFLEKGPDKLLDALQDTRRVGYIRTPTSIGWDLRFARQEKDDEGGRRVFVITDRPIGFREAATRPRSIDYPFTFIEMHLNRSGEGEGRASVATKITFNKRTNTIELENYSTQPVLLTKVTERQ